MIGDVAGRGLFIGVELVKNRETKEPAAQETAWIQNECYKRGFLIQRAGYYGNRFNNYPTLMVTEEEIDRAMEVMDSVMSDAERKYR
jgi:4-aminobutyrate aminotransferase-like enzyme